MQKSAKLKLFAGVLGRPKRLFDPPGVFMIEDGSGVAFDGGVEGGCMVLRDPWCGVGEVARYMSRSAPSLGVLDHETLDSLWTR